MIPLDNLKPLEISNTVTLETPKKNSAEIRKDALRNLPWDGSHLYCIVAGVQKFQRYCAFERPLNEIRPPQGAFEANC